MKLINIKKYAAILILLMTGTMAASVNAQTCSGSNISVDSSQNCPSVDVGSDINSITNAGIIGSGNFGIDLVGSVSPSNITVGTITNMATGAIGSGYYGVLIASNAYGANQSIILTINAINNAGSISASAYAILSDAALGCPVSCNNSTSRVSIGSIVNMATGVISSDLYGILNIASVGGHDYAGVSNTATIGSIVNSGVISGVYAIYNSGNDVSGTNTVLANIGTIQNSGSINGVSYGINNQGQINGISNTGSITAGNSNPQMGINNGGTIGTLVNSSSGSIDAYIGIQNGGTINTLTNEASITGIDYGIVNYGTITTLNNGQGAGNLNGALTLFQNLPTNYNIIINSKSNYGQLALNGVASGAMTFGIYGGSNVSKGTYASVLSASGSGVIPAYLVNTSGIYNGFTWKLIETDTTNDIWNLVVTGASTAETQQSLVNTAQALQGAFNLQTSIIRNGLSYDCSLFDAHGLCISTGGRFTNTNTPTGDSTGALVIGGYRVNDNVRVGAYLDQGVSSSTPTGINLKQHNPLFGAFAVWQARQDGLGAQVKVAAGYNYSDMTVTRAVVGTSEAGSGSTGLISQAVSVVGSYGVEMQGSWIASPYVGIRYTDVKAGGYTETTSSTVTAPLSYASLSQSTTSLLAGIRWTGKLTDRVGLNGSVGVEQDVSNNNSSYTATGVDGLTSIVFNTDINKTRPVASIGTTVSIDKRQQLAFSVMYREEAFSKSSTTSAYGTYTIGF